MKGLRLRSVAGSYLLGSGRLHRGRRADLTLVQVAVASGRVAKYGLHREEDEGDRG
jgi:hypothetical protein